MENGHFDAGNGSARKCSDGGDEGVKSDQIDECYESV
jgi:hypothetical protein